MATVYRRAGGYKLEKLIGKHEDVQNRMDEVAEHIRRRATAELAKHEDTGDSYIEAVGVGTKLPDRYITLNDERGQGAAMSIEYGRRPSYSEDGDLIDPGMEGIAPLRKAAAIHHGR